MKKKSQRLLAFIFLLFPFLSSFSQDLCSPVGWATQNGGTTGGGTATPVTVTTLATLQAQASSTGAKVIYVSGTVGTGVGTRVSVAANKTIIGLPGAKLIGGFDVRANNVIIRNMIVQGPGAVDVNGVDCINIDAANNVWIDHCDIIDGQDGNLDIVNGANFVAVTWCKFSYTAASSNHQFCNLLGNSDSKTSDRGKLKITMMYNWWTAGCKERMPRVRFGQVHVVNNLFDSKQASHCVRAGKEADILVESNYFDAVKTPIDLYQNNFTAVTSKNNFYATTTGNTAGSGNAFTPPYSLAITPASNVKAIVSNTTCGAGATMASPTTCGCGTTPVTYALSTNSLPVAGGTVSGAGSYNTGTVVTITATPAAGYSFTGWSGDASGTNTSTTVTMSAYKSVTANFTLIPTTTYTLSTSASPTVGGTVTGAGTYNAGNVTTVIATPAAGYRFVNWSGDASGTNASTTVTMSANKSAIANFALITPTIYTLSTLANPSVGGTITGAGTYIVGSVASITATPAAGYTFINWSGAASGTNASTSVIMSANRSVTANFQLSGGSGTSTIRIEDNATPATGLCLVEGAISSNSGANNAKVINLTNSSGKGVNWRVNVPSTGLYTLNWRYANSSTSNTFSMKFILNGVLVNAALPFPKTSGSSIFLNTIVTVNLIAGNNTIRLESIASNATADIDWIEITGNSPQAGNCAAARSSLTTAITNNTNIDQKIGVFPNPTNGTINIGFHLKSPENISLRIANAKGEIVANEASKLYVNGYHQMVYTLAKKSPGLYTVILDGSKEFKTRYKIIVQ